MPISAAHPKKRQFNIYARKIENYWMNCTRTVTFQQRGDHNVSIMVSCVDYHLIKIMIIPRYMSDFLSWTFCFYVRDDTTTLKLHIKHSISLCCPPLAVILPLWCKFWRAAFKKIISMFIVTLCVDLTAHPPPELLVSQTSCELSKLKNEKGDENESIMRSIQLFNWINSFCFFTLPFYFISSLTERPRV
jgi:hypothetical protein